MDLATQMGSHTDDNKLNSVPGSADNFGEYGTTVKDLYKFFSNIDEGNLFPTFSSNSLYASENSDETEAWVEDAKDSFFVKWIQLQLFVVVEKINK